MPDDRYARSTYAAIVDAATVVVNAAVSAIDANQTPVFRRKKPVLLEGDAVPCWVVAPAAEAPRILWQTFGRGVAYAYPVQVVGFYPSNAIITAMEGRYDPANDVTEREFADVMRMTEEVRQAVFKPSLTDAPTVFDAEVAQASAFETPAANGRLYAISGLVVTYHSLESRAA